MAELREKTVLGARALEWTILSAARSEETLAAEWFRNRHWEEGLDDPASRMKADADHRVPLTGRMLEILKSLPRGGEHVFPGQIHQREHQAP